MFLMVPIGYVGFPQYERILNVAQNYYCKSSIKLCGGGGGGGANSFQAHRGGRLFESGAYLI